MPYIEQKARQEIDPDNKIRVLGYLCMTPGELNWLITSAVDGYIEKVGLNYVTLNEVVGVLECAKLELYRRLAAPYEDQKIIANGDVYGNVPQ